MTETTLAGQPRIHTVLDVCTGHLTRDDEALLAVAAGDAPAPAVVVYSYHYGYIVFVTPDDCAAELETAGLSSVFRHLMARARALGCDYIKFDADGTKYGDVPVFDWDHSP